MKYVLCDGTKVLYDKSPKFVELMLDLEFFHKIYASIRTIKLILLITILHFKGLERNKGDMGAKKRHYLMFLIGLWHSK
jgi:hypothetical protein